MFDKFFSSLNFCFVFKGYVYRQALYACLTCLKDNLKTEENDAKAEDAYLETDEKFLHAICLGCTYGKKT